MGREGEAPYDQQSKYSLQQFEILMRAYGQAVDFFDRYRRERNRYYNLALAMLLFATISVWHPGFVAIILELIRFNTFFSFNLDAPVDYFQAENVLGLFSWLLPELTLSPDGENSEARNHPWYFAPFFVLHAITSLTAIYLQLAFQQRALIARQWQSEAKVLARAVKSVYAQASPEKSEDAPLNLVYAHLGSEEPQSIRRFRKTASKLNRALTALVGIAYASGLFCAAMIFAVTRSAQSYVVWGVPAAVVILTIVGVLVLIRGASARGAVSESGAAATHSGDAR